ncbi:MAG: TolC family protein [Bacteroidota bacterium]
MKYCLLYIFLFFCINLQQLSAQSLTPEEITSMLPEDKEISNDSTIDFNKMQPSKLDLNRDIKEQLLPLDSIIQIAKRNNPGVKMNEALVKSGEAQVRYAKSEWLRNISFNFNNSYGNTTLFYTSNETPVETQTQNLNTGYRAGVNINIPLYEFFGRQHRVDIYRNELLAKDEQRKNTEMELANRVIYEYNYAVAAHRMMMISSENMQAALTHLAMAEKEFSEGVIPVGESARITEFAAKAKMDFETSKREFFVWYMQLETLVGVRLDTLVRSK